MICPANRKPHVNPWICRSLTANPWMYRLCCGIWMSTSHHLILSRFLSGDLLKCCWIFVCLPCLPSFILICTLIDSFMSLLVTWWHSDWEIVINAMTFKWKFSINSWEMQAIFWASPTASSRLRLKYSTTRYFLCVMAHTRSTHCLGTFVDRESCSQNFRSSHQETVLPVPTLWPDWFSQWFGRVASTRSAGETNFIAY